MKKILNIFLVGILVTGLSSCLKDKTMIGPDSPGAIKNVIEFANLTTISSGTGSIYPVYSLSFDVVPNADLAITVNYAGVDNAPQDINVKVAIDPSIITKYNAKLVKDARDNAIELGEDPDDAEDAISADLFDQLDPSAYTVPSLDLTIPKGQRTATFTIGLKPVNFDFNKNSALPFKIVSASTGTISGNFGDIIVQIAGKNKYDGVYNVVPTAPFVDLVAPANKGMASMKAELRTIDATRVAMYDGEYATNNFAHAFEGGYYGNWSPVFNMDAANNVIAVTNYFGQGTNPQVRAGKLTVTGVNKWTINGDSRVMEVSYVMTQGGVDRLIYAEKWTRTGSR